MNRNLLSLLLTFTVLCTSCRQNETQLEVTKTTTQTTIQETSITENSTVDKITTENQVTSSIEYIPSDDIIKSVVTDYIQSLIDCDVEKYLSVVYDTTDREEVNPTNIISVIEPFSLYNLFEEYNDYQELYNILKNDLNIISVGDYIFLNHLNNYDIEELKEEYPNMSVDDFIICNFKLLYKDQVGEYSILLCFDNSGNWKIANEDDIFYNSNIENIMKSKYYDLF
ncbi:MAG: hypothetical protein ACI4WH_07285 [Oscillospiraceae bacterium]